jgi:hypothetical protein
MFKRIYAKLAARKIENIVQDLVDHILKTYANYLNLIPPLAGAVTQVLINNKAEIEAAITTTIKVRDELEVVLRDFVVQLEVINEVDAKNTREFIERVNEFFDSFKEQ